VSTEDANEEYDTHFDCCICGHLMHHTLEYILAA
jgi:transcription elongation factor Elf1